MKKVSILLVLLFSIGTLAIGQSSVLDEFFEQYENQVNGNIVNISPKMFEMIANMDWESDNPDPEVAAELEQMIEKMKGLRILTQEGEGSRQMYEEALALINGSDFEELMRVRDGEEEVRIVVKDENGGKIVNELALLVGSDKEFVLMNFVGYVNLKVLGKLSKSLNAPSLEHLEQMDKDD